MKKYLTLALILLTVGSFAQTTDTTINEALIVDFGIRLIEPTPNIVFTTPTDKVFSLNWGSDTLKFTSEIPLDEAAEKFFNYLGRHYSTVIDSLKIEIMCRDNMIRELNSEILIYKEFSDNVEKIINK